MKINIDVKRNFKINGKEYNSLEAMPDDIREAFKKAMVSQQASGTQINFDEMHTKIVFNGTEYESIDVMPHEIRQLYKKILKSAETGAASSDGDLTEISKKIIKKTITSGTSPSRELRQPLKIETSFSLKRFLVSVILVAFILVLYYLFKSI